VGEEAIGQYARIGEVETWWDVRGDGDPIVLLHPGGADSRARATSLDQVSIVKR
jgi:hypothetical protein